MRRTRRAREELLGREPVRGTDIPSVGFDVVGTMTRFAIWSNRWQLRVRGLRHVPVEGGAVLVWNHHSHVDFIMCAYPIYRLMGRSVRFLAAREVFEHRVLGWAPRLANAVPVDRGSSQGRAGAFTDAVKVLRDGGMVMVAPEGTISTSFELLPFRTGAARMAQMAGVPIIPSVSWGTQRLTTTGHKLSFRRARRIPVDIRYAAPIHVGPDDDVVEVTAHLQEVMGVLLEQVQNDYPERPGPGEDPWWIPARLGGSAPTREEALAEQARRTNWGVEPDARPQDTSGAG